MTFNFMNEGGMIDSGMDVDPQSGNEIPPGSLDQEVSDDVDAKLSEGEYVLPANVVQFYGLEKIESWVNKAEEKLAEMDQAGRIGGEPVDGPAEDDLPFSTEELAYSDDGIPAEKAFNEGGFVPSQWGFGGVGPGTGNITTRKYIGEDGSVRNFTFINGDPIQFIPEGFTPYEEGQETPTRSVSPGSASVDKDWGSQQEDDSPEVAARKRKPYTPEEWEMSDFEKYVERQNDGVEKGIGGAVGMASPVVGAAMNLGTRLTDRRAVNELDRRIADDTIAPEERERYSNLRRSLGDDSRDRSDRGGLLGGGLLDKAVDSAIDFVSGSGKSTRPTGDDSRDRTPTSSPRPTARPTQSGSSVTKPRPTKPVTSSPRPTPRPTTSSPRPRARPSGSARGEQAYYKKGGYVKRRK